MLAKDLKRKYLKFFQKKGHKVLPNVSLVPEDVSSSALFISAGMHTLIPYLLGEPHPLGKRLMSNQRCLRTSDIEVVGDQLHLTFFEMLGNWSLGDYWKEEAISCSWEIMTRLLSLPKEKISVSCFSGDQDAPRDDESAGIWKKLGVPQERIYFFSKNENWWGPVESTGPCGPSSEMFIDMGGDCRLSKKNCDPSCQCGKYFEIWNDVFMEYNKIDKNKYEPLKQRSVDTGMGVERTVTFLQGKDDIFEIQALVPIIKKVEEISGRKYEGESKKPIRVIADHLRAATFLIADGVVPSNVDQGYVLRRLIRKAARYGQKLSIKSGFTLPIAQTVIKGFTRDYPYLPGKKESILAELKKEEEKFGETLSRGLKKLEKLIKSGNFPDGILPGRVASGVYETYGLPLEFIQDVASEKDLKVDREGFQKAQIEHQNKSRVGSEKKFAGGLADRSGAVIKLHTTTHLLHQALRNVLGNHVEQVGSNITPERLRFDFVHPEKLSETEIKQVEEIVNQQINADLPVKMEMMSLERAKKRGALALFAQKYGEKVKTYTVGNPPESSRRLGLGRGNSFEVCGGPHVKSTGEIGGVKIYKEKAVGSGRRRIYAKLVNSKLQIPNSK